MNALNALIDRLRAGNIDDPNSEAYRRWGAGRSQVEGTPVVPADWGGDATPAPAPVVYAENPVPAQTMPQLTPEMVAAMPQPTEMAPQPVAQPAARPKGKPKAKAKQAVYAENPVPAKSYPENPVPQTPLSPPPPQPQRMAPNIYTGKQVPNPQSDRTILGDLRILLGSQGGAPSAPVRGGAGNPGNPMGLEAAGINPYDAAILANLRR